MQVFLWFKPTTEVNYRQTFGTETDIDKYVELVKKWGGDSRTANAGGSKRGWNFSVEHLPIPVVRDVFRLVGGGRKGGVGMCLLFLVFLPS